MVGADILYRQTYCLCLEWSLKDSYLSPIERYLNQVLYDLACLRLQRCAKLAAKGKLHIREHMTGTRLEFEGAAGDDAKAITAQAEAEIAAAGEEPTKPKEEFKQNIAAAEEYIRGADPAMPTLAARIGFDLSDLPPLEKLSDDQVVAILGELVPLLVSFGKTFAGPKDYPPRLTYPIVLKMTLATHGTSMNGGWVDDGCTGDPVGCTWGMYCTCLKYSRREDFESQGGEKGYPDERFFQGKGDPFGYTEPTEEEKAERAAFDALSPDEKFEAIEAKRANDPPCPWHGDACGTR